MNEILKYFEASDKVALSLVSRELYDKSARFKQSAYGRIVNFRDFMRKNHDEFKDEITSYKASYQAGFFRPGQVSKTGYAALTILQLFFLGLVIAMLYHNLKKFPPEAFIFSLMVPCGILINEYFYRRRMVKIANKAVRRDTPTENELQSLRQLLVRIPFIQNLAQRDQQLVINFDTTNRGEIELVIERVAAIMNVCIQRLMALQISLRGEKESSFNQIILSEFSELEELYRIILKHFQNQWNLDLKNQDSQISLLKR